jgi:hypothetical protein
MISALRLGNFKAFAETQHIPIRPLTLIFGANSSGKSSILHGLLLAHHGMKTGELNAFRTTLGGDSVDLGGFRQYIYRRDVQRHMEWGIELDTAQMTGRLAELLAPVRMVRVALTIGVVQDIPATAPGGVPAVLTYELSVDDEPLLRMSRRPDNTLRMDRLQREHPVIRKLINAIIELSTTSQLTDQDYADLEQAIDALVAEIAFPQATLLPAHLPRIEHTFGAGSQMSFFINQSNREEKLAEAVRFFLPRSLDDLVSGLSDEIQRIVHSLRYLGPLRSYPPRHHAFSQHYDLNWFAGGGYAWDVVRHDDQVRAKVNRWLSDPQRLQSPYELVLREMVSTEQLDVPLFTGLQETIEQGVEVQVEPGMGYDAQGEMIGGGSIPILQDPDAEVERLKQHIASADIDRLHELVMVDRRTGTTVSHRDIGIGISQVLPVLVSAFATSNNLVAIEQPEIHLHPALQAELGDIFIESALGAQRNTFVLETHSEHLILRIMRRMRDTARGTLPAGVPEVRPQDVAVLFVQPAHQGNTAIVQHLRLDTDGELLDPWPGGFFEESFYEQFA